MQETWWKARHSAGIAEATQISVPLLLPYLSSVFMEVRFWGSPMRLPHCFRPEVNPEHLHYTDNCGKTIKTVVLRL